MSLTKRARELYSDRRMAAKWVVATRILKKRGLHPYRHLPMAVRIVIH